MGLERYTRQAIALRPPAAAPGRERDLQPDGDPGRDQDRARGGDRRRHDHLAAAVDPLRRRRREARDRGALGRRPARLARRASASRHAAARRAREGAGRCRPSPRSSRGSADAIVAVSDAIADGDAGDEPARAGRDDLERLRLRGLRRARVRAPADRFRITHAGSFFGKRDPRPFLTALVAGRRRRRALRRRLPGGRPRVGSRDHGPDRAHPLRPPPPGARAPARLGGAAAPDPRGRRPREGRALRARSSSTWPPSARSSRSSRPTAPPPT